ncbi:MAG: DUF2063 domain-containing protein [Sedimenticola sp.]|nr:MAG: DUF2063 domain-containing protein [Sedimenticola sp.]
MSAAPDRLSINPLPEFQRQQYAFAAHIRDPELAPCPDDVTHVRMAVYRELFYNNIEGTLSNAFPVIRSLYADSDWHSLIHGFFSTHRAQTPYFSKLPEAFLNYLEQERTPQSDDPDFLIELAHYEWVELALSISDQDIEIVSFDIQGDPVTGIPALSPLAWRLSYRYPVHRISPDNRPEFAPDQPTHLVVYRDRQDDVGFLELNPVTARLLQLVSENQSRTGIALLEQIAREMNHPNPQTVLAGGRQIFSQLQQHDVLLGTKPARQGIDA